MLGEGTSSIIVGLSLGLALAGAPGPVQAVLFAEAIQGGVLRGLKVLLGADLAFGLLAVSLASGLTVIAPNEGWLRILRIAGGAFLLILALDGLRSANDGSRGAANRGSSTVARGGLAVLLNPGAWIFLGVVASPLFATADQQGGRLVAILTALALVAGIAIGDVSIVLVGGFGLRRARPEIGVWLKRALAALLGALAVSLIANGVLS